MAMILMFTRGFPRLFRAQVARRWERKIPSRSGAFSELTGQTLLIIEAMKTFNPIKAPKAGTLVQILIDNAQPVEFEQPLMIVE